MSADVSFASNQFPKYKLGPDNEILDEVKEDIQCPSLKEVVVEETHQLTEQHKQLSVRDLACKFSKNLSAAPKLSEATSIDEEKYQHHMFQIYDVPLSQSNVMNDSLWLGNLHACRVQDGGDVERALLTMENAFCEGKKILVVDKSRLKSSSIWARIRVLRLVFLLSSPLIFPTA
ncbi:stomatal closure-related actin-binding protein 2 [Forsythia ovata]|uniref:Stomatal closure-related actin-binding protein 2 n=1 Tax=Forsythia ovata TaxID=205694 RepID=A0ABD1WDI8_9LAMI